MVLAGEMRARQVTVPSTAFACIGRPGSYGIMETPQFTAILWVSG